MTDNTNSNEIWKADVVIISKKQLKNIFGNLRRKTKWKK